MPRLLSLFLSLTLCTSAASAQIVDLPGLPKDVFLSLAARGDTLLAGSMQEIFASFDGGATWNALSKPEAAAQGVDALVLTDAGWFAGLHTKGVYHSTDEGRSWRLHSTGLVGMGSRNISAFHARDGWLYAATDGAGVFRLNLESLGTWQHYGTEFAENEAETLIAMTMHRGALVAAGGGNGLVFVERPAEAAWRPVFVRGQTLDFASTDSILAAISISRCHFSRDGGFTWEPTGEGLGAGIHAALAAAGSEFYAARTVGEGISVLYRSTDLSGAWESVVTTSETIKMLAHGGRLYLAQADGLRAYELTPVGVPPGEVDPALPRLDLPYPNPAAGFMQVGFTLSSPGPARLSVFDALGRHVAVLYDGIAPSGQTPIAWSAGAVPPGVYFVHLTAGGTTRTQSIVVLH